MNTTRKNSDEDFKPKYSEYDSTVKVCVAKMLVKHRYNVAEVIKKDVEGPIKIELQQSVAHQKSKLRRPKEKLEW